MTRNKSSEGKGRRSSSSLTSGHIRNIVMSEKRSSVRFTRTTRFKRAWERLEEAERDLARKALRNLAADISYPALRTRKMTGTDSVWEARVSRSLRVTFEIQRDVMVLRNIGRHDETLDHP